MRVRWVTFALIAACLCDISAADRSVDPIVSRIPHEEVDSSALASVGYSKRLHALEIEFRRGGTYRYLDVSPSVHHKLLAADSKAHFYNTQIRGKYRAIRVRSSPAELQH